MAGVGRGQEREIVCVNMTKTNYVYVMVKPIIVYNIMLIKNIKNFKSSFSLGTMNFLG